MLSLVEQALKADHVLLSNAGAHAGEELDEIIGRKHGDIDRLGHSIWVLNSNKGTPDKVQDFCRRTGAEFVLFVEPVTPNRGTVKADPATQFSSNEGDWQKIGSKLSPVTGFIRRNTTGLWLKAIEKVHPATGINFTDYKDYADEEKPVRFYPSDNAIPAKRISPVNSATKLRSLIAVGRLQKPYAVWLSR